jgi:hypothetical protein
MKRTQNEIRQQLEVLTAEVKLLSSSFAQLRQDDFRMVFGEQIRPILKERINRFFSEDRRASEAGSREKLKSPLVDLVDSVVDTYEKKGREEASRVIDNSETSLAETVKSEQNLKLTTFVSALIRQLRDYLVLSDQVSHQGTSQKKMIAPSAKEAEELSPMEAESVLSPLANSWRINVLSMLSKDDESLAGLSKALGLKKGHLQFHLKILLDARYIRYNRKSRLYSITDRGAVAVDGVERLIDRLGSI